MRNWTSRFVMAVVVSALPEWGCSSEGWPEGTDVNPLDVRGLEDPGRLDGAPGEHEEGVDPSDVWQGLLDVEQEFATLPEILAWQDLPPDSGGFCRGDGDGVLVSTEIPAADSLGAVVTFTQNAFGTVTEVPSPEGSWDAGCACYRWDFRAVGSQDGVVYDGVMPPGAFWFQDRMPGGQFVQSFGNGQLGIYRLASDGLYLVGLASEVQHQTALSYTTQPSLLKLPMKLGDSWSSLELQASGLYEGQEYPWNTGLTGTVSVRHSFQSRVDRQGFVQVPAGEFAVWRVVLDITMEVSNSLNPVPIARVTRKVVMFVSECVGLVVRVASREGETDDFFTQATEFRRLGLPE